MQENLNRIIEETQDFLSPNIASFIRNIEKGDMLPMLSEAVTAKKAYDRALMVRLGCEAVGGNWKDALYPMLAVELMDFSVIVVDDILDESPRRREDFTVQKKWGLKNAVIVASILKSMSIQAALSMDNNIKIRDLINILEQVHREIYIGLLAKV